MAKFLLGRKRPPQRPTFKIKDFFKSLPTPPAWVNYKTPAMTALHNIYLNDQLGDCVIAGGYHVEGVTTAGAGKEFVASDTQITNDYSAIGGYVPGNPNTDNGCDEQTALTYWTQHGFASGNKIGCWMAVDATNVTEMKQCLYLFENLYSGLELPDAYTNPFPSGDNFVWDVAGDPDPDQGHCVTHFGYNSKYVVTDTWGMVGYMTWAAMAKYMVPNAGGELYVLVMPDMIKKASQKAPNGLNWAALAAAANALGGNLPVPA